VSALVEQYTKSLGQYEELRDRRSAFVGIVEVIAEEQSADYIATHIRALTEARRRVDAASR
jgi:hypothetical protein